MKRSLYYLALIGLVAMVLAGSSVPGEAAQSSPASRSPDHKALAARGLVETGQQDRENSSPIRLRIGSFVPVAGERLPIPPELAIADDELVGPGYHIVQFQGPIDQEWKARVASLGGQVLDYVPDFAFVVYMDDVTRAGVETLPEVVWIGPFQPAYKLSPDLTEAQGVLDLVVQTFPTEMVDAVSIQLSALGARVQDSSQNLLGGQLRLTIDAAQLTALAHVPAVRWIEPFHERVLFNDVARGNSIMAAETLWSDLGLYGEGQVVAISDTGLDTGSLSTIHQDFRGNPTGCSGTNRILATYALGRSGDWSDSCRYFGTNHGGHGTHVAGSVLGNGCRAGSGGVPDYSGSYAGLAPQASLVFQSVMDSSCGLGGLPNDLNELFSQAEGAGAQIHTNSWGAAVSGQYTTDSYNTDEYLWSDKDYTILFSAGNSGTDSGDPDGFIDADSIGAPGTAKNCITVGASENYRLSGGLNPGGPCDTWGTCWPDDYGTNPIRDDRLSDNAAGMVAFSSRGPTNDGRLKPDVVAPGSNILSTKSQATYVSGGWGDGPSQYYQYMGGTSMSTPLTAGAMALIRDWYTDIKLVTPSSALLKATVINSAVNMHPGQYGSPLEQQPQLPNNIQGWGRVNVANATDDSHLFEDIPDGSGLQTGASHTYNYQVCTAPLFKITLVWTDYPGSTLVNDLDLTVTSPGGTVYRGNVFTNGWSASGGSADRTNNVESVYLQSPAAGTWTVTVNGYNVPQGTRPGYALVVDMPDNVCEPDFTLSVTPDSQDVCVSSAAFYDVAVGSVLDFHGTVAFSADINPPGPSASFDPLSLPAPGNSVLTIGSTASAGTYTIDVIGTSDSLTHSDAVTLRLFDPLSAGPSLTTPADGAMDITTTPAFAWNDLPNESGYTLEIATDPDFATIVDSPALPADTTSYSGATLSSDTVYYWRVRGSNACGFADSPVFAFRTHAIGCTTYPSSDIPKAISDREWTESILAVPDSFDITDVDVIVEEIDHTYDADLDIYIRHPDTTDVELSTDNGGSGDDYTDTRFDDEAATAITAGTAPFSGSYRPEGSLAILDGKDAQGTWTLRIYDDSNRDTGTLRTWSLVVCGGSSSFSADYSDLAGSYGVAWHTGDGALRLGNTWSADDGGFGAGQDNDDGVSFPDGLQAGQTKTVRVNVQGTPENGRWLRVWFDWNRDGVFEDTTGSGGEYVYDGTAGNGDNDLPVDVPSGYSQPVNYRVRLYDAASSPTGITARDTGSYGGATGGEVEDDPTPGPTAVTLARFEARPAGSAIRVEWETATEIDTLGFHLYRSPRADGGYERLNEQIIPSQAPGSPGGGIYFWTDDQVVPGQAYYYKLEDVDIHGAATLHGPRSAIAAHVRYLPLVAK